MHTNTPLKIEHNVPVPPKTTRWGDAVYATAAREMAPGDSVVVPSSGARTTMVEAIKRIHGPHAAAASRKTPEGTYRVWRLAGTNGSAAA